MALTPYHAVFGDGISSDQTLTIKLGFVNLQANISEMIRDTSGAWNAANAALNRIINKYYEI